MATSLAWLQSPSSSGIGVHDSLITLRMTAVRFFEMSGSNYQTTRRNSPEYLLPQHALGGNLEPIFSYCLEYFWLFFPLLYCVLLGHGWFSVIAIKR
jgi:hypothetical protein